MDELEILLIQDNGSCRRQSNESISGADRTGTRGRPAEKSETSTGQADSGTTNLGSLSKSGYQLTYTT
jgi:hypothetical protein